MCVSINGQCFCAIFFIKNDKECSKYKKTKPLMHICLYFW